MNHNLKQILDEDSGSDWDSIIEPPIILKETLPTTKNVPESHNAEVSRKNSLKKSESNAHSTVLQFLDSDQKELPPFNFKGVVSDDENGPFTKPIPLPGKPKKHQYDPSFANTNSTNKESSGDTIQQKFSLVNVGFDSDNEDLTKLNESHTAAKSSLSSTFGKLKEDNQKSWKKEIGDKKSDVSGNKKKLRLKMKNNNLPEEIDFHDGSQDNVKDPISVDVDKSSNLKKGISEPKSWINKNMSCPHFSERPERCHFAFNHGSYECFYVANENEGSCVDPMADKYSRKLKTIYLEIFNGIGIVFDSITLFILQLLRFVLTSIVHPFTIGIFLVICDFLLKPALAALFNGLLQPILIFLWNILVSFARLLEPFLSLLSQLCELTANLCKSVRIIEINHYHQFPATKKTEIV